MRSWISFLLLSGAALSGTRPRVSPSDYKVHDSQGGVTIAAEIVPANQVKNLLAADLSRRYIVVEAAAFPSGSLPLEIGEMDFLLRCGADENIRAANPRAIPYALHGSGRRSTPGPDIYQTAEIGYESGPYGRGVTGGTGIAIGLGNSGVSGPLPDPGLQTMEYELEARGFPGGPAAGPVSGFLYFPVPKGKQKKLAYELEYSGPTSRIRLLLK